MPLHINLYHEVQRQELARQRDPFRLAMLAILVIAIGFVANYFVVLERSHTIAIRYTNLKDAWDKIQPQADKAKARQDELNAEIQVSDDMIKNVNSREYWAPVLDQILKAVPRSVQLTHVGAQVPGDEKSLYSTIEVSGISSAPEPRKEAEIVRTALNARLSTQFKNVTSVFKTLDDSDQFVMLDGQRLPTASFTMEFQLQVRDPVVEATPPPHKSRGSSDE